MKKSKRRAFTPAFRAEAVTLCKVGDRRSIGRCASPVLVDRLICCHRSELGRRFELDGAKVSMRKRLRSDCRTCRCSR